jgi:hypothetical protein
LESANNTPTTAADPNLVGLPSHNAAFTPVTPLKAGQQIPIAIGTTNGNTCTPMINVIG